MKVFLLQFVMFLGIFLVFNVKNFGLRYLVLYLMPFYAVALIYLNFVTAAILPVHLFSVFVIGWMLATGKTFDKKIVIKCSIMLFPFIFSLIYNTFFFEPIMGWEVEQSKRPNGRALVMKYSLSATNISQLGYVVFGIIMCAVYASLEIDKKKLRTVMTWMLYFVSFSGILQSISWYTGWHETYKLFLNTTNAIMANQVFLWDWKRINATFQEPSYYGHYLYFTLLFYLICFGYDNFRREKAVKLTIIMGILSTATTFYLGFLVLLLIMYVFYSSVEEKMYYYIVICVLAVITLYFGVDIIQQYLGAKESSTDGRFHVSWTVAWPAIFKVPWFGAAYGTQRPLFIYTQFLISIGVIGTIVFLYGLFYGGNTRRMNLYLLGVLGVGIGAYEMTRHEMWIYLGLLANKSLQSQSDEIT